MPQLSAGIDGFGQRAEKALNKKARWGPDIDLERYLPAVPRGAALAGVDEALFEAGIEPGGRGRAGTYLQSDSEVLCRSVDRSWKDLVEIMPVAEALKRRSFPAGLWWTSVAPDADKYTARTALQGPEGCYLAIQAGAKIEEPLQACFLMGQTGTVQCVHNIIVAGDGASAHIITGCTTPHVFGEGLHIGVTECYVGAGASLTLTMIHNWGEGFHARPRSVTTVEAGGTFVSNYVLLKPLQSLQMFPAVILRGEGSRCRFHSLIAGLGSAVIDVGNRVVHEGADTGSESVSRAIAGGHSAITTRGRIEARTDYCRGHLECIGMIRSPEASIAAVPELDVQGAPRADLSHEAAISPVAEEEVAYLMSRGISREDAVATIMRGFLDVDLLALPAPLQRTVDRQLALATGEPE